jgi:hypothetical protein
MIEPIARIRIELQGIEPKIWRRVDVPLSSTLMNLHDIIQVVMGWRDDHLFEFNVGDKIYGEPFPDDSFEERTVYKAKSIRLQSLHDRGFDQFLYIYDFGDHWCHDVIIEDLCDGEADTDYPSFIDGARRCPPEDVGSTMGYAGFLEAVTDPAHEEHDQMLTWYGRPYDPDDINERRVRRVIESFAVRRRGPLQSHRQGNRPKNH